eukprot:m.187860 g.187860  ORF g.187860 m.187860 type:complete len:480 (-) comp18170_c3_seq1:76-1515(-)
MAARPVPTAALAALGLLCVFCVVDVRCTPTMHTDDSGNLHVNSGSGILYVNGQNVLGMLHQLDDRVTATQATCNATATTQPTTTSWPMRRFSSAMYEKVDAGSAAGVEHRFGRAVDLMDDTLLVGAYKNNLRRAFVFSRNALSGVWDFEAILTPIDSGSDQDRFGFSVTLGDGGDTAFVGADGHTSGRGAVYVFRRDSPGTWTQIHKLEPFDAPANADFGIRLSFRANTLAVGARGTDDHGTETGAVYVMRRDHDDLTWSHDAKLVPTTVGADHNVGFHVALDSTGTTLVAGAPGADDAGTASGAAVVWTFNHATTNWTETQRLTPLAHAEDTHFGFSVAFGSDDVLVIGASGADPSSTSDAGAVYVFTRSGSTGLFTQTQKLLPNDPTVSGNFGVDVAASPQNTIVVGANGRSSRAGAVYVFRRDSDSTDTWTQQVMLSDSTDDDELGTAVAISGGNIAAGAYGEDDRGFNSGAVLIF